MALACWLHMQLELSNKENALIKKLVGCLTIEPQAQMEHPSCLELDTYRARLSNSAPDSAHLVARPGFPPSRLSRMQVPVTWHFSSVASYAIRGLAVQGAR